MSLQHNGNGATVGNGATGSAVRPGGVRCSTIDKVHQIVAVRREVLARESQRLQACASAMAAAFAAGGRLFAMGNGGSCTDAADLVSLFLYPGPGRLALPAFALTGDIAVLTALSNDVSFDVVFARQIAAFGRRGDVVVGLSTSGNSTKSRPCLRRGGQAWPAHRRFGGVRGRGDGRTGEHRPPVRGAFCLRSPDTGGADHDLPHPVGAHAQRADHRKARSGTRERRAVARGVGDH
jgi:hypothetical protein